MTPDNTATATVSAPPTSITFEEGVAALKRMRTEGKSTTIPATAPLPDNAAVSAASDATTQADPAVVNPENTETQSTPEETTEQSETLPADDSVIFHMEDGTPVTALEARNSYYRQSDYTRDKQALSSLQEVVRERSGINDQAAAFFADNMPRVLQLLQKSIPAEPDPNLRASNPVSYWDQYNARQAAINEHLQMQQMHQLSLAAQQQLAQQRDVERYQVETEKLLQAMPDWRDGKVRSRDLGEINRYATDLGFSPDELVTMDHRLVRVLRDAVIGAKVRKGGQKGGAVPQRNGNPTLSSGQATNAVRPSQAARDRETLRSVAANSAGDAQERMRAAVALLGPRTPQSQRR